MTERLVAIAQAARQARHGERGPIYDTACRELCISRAKLLRKLKEVAVMNKRKKRADSGKTALLREEALIISGAWLESRRNNDKRLYSLDNLVTHLRSNNMIVAGRVDDATGEFIPLSVSAISRALLGYRLHYDQLQNPTPSLELASLHPNHVWQIDASICVLYYLKNPNKRAKGDSGLRVMGRDEFYKNKPKNLERIVNDRVWSFEIICHTTHWIYVEYRFGGESAENFLEVMINAMQERGGADVLHGVPIILYTDPGSALISASLTNMCRALGIQCISHKARNARATGAVEKARDIIECDFEAGLKFVRIDNIEQLNQYARLWRMNYNRTKIHSRHGMSRTDGWLKITPEQLVKAPPREVCRELAVSAPESRKVTSKLRIPFRGQEYCVADIPGVCVGDSVMVARNPWHNNEARLVVLEEDGFDRYYPIYAVEKTDTWNYSVSAPIIGQRYGNITQTEAQNNLVEVGQIVYGTENNAETEAARKAKALPFGGQFNPYLDIEQDNHPAYLPRRGQASTVRSPCIELHLLTHVEAAKILKSNLKSKGLDWKPEYFQHITQQWPDGVPVEELQVFGDKLSGQSSPALRLVNQQ